MAAARSIVGVRYFIKKSRVGARGDTCHEGSPFHRKASFFQLRKGVIVVGAVCAINDCISGTNAVERGMDFETLSEWADEEVKAVIHILPADIQQAAEKCVVSFEPKPGNDSSDADLSGDELGLFEGVCLLDEPSPADLPRIRIFVENIWAWVEGDEQDFRDEIGTTFLHELGHYLGWDEDEVNERGLE